jgi:D-sedoheptulose 7-phosphate isomerase
MLSSDVIILGNGGSNATSCHIAEDYTKILNKRTICFGDSARMSCYANDYGWENSYSKFIEHFYNPNTLVILLSASGESKNIINAAQFCVDNNIEMITLTGNSKENTLKTKFSKINGLDFWVDSYDYGVVEIIHETILHSII